MPSSPEAKQVKRIGDPGLFLLESTVTAVHVWVRPMLPVTFVSVPSSASMVMARRRDIQRAVENSNGAIRLDGPMMKPDGLRSVAEMATREEAHAYRDERWLRSSCQMSVHTLVANTKEVEHAQGHSHGAG